MNRLIIFFTALVFTGIISINNACSQTIIDSGTCGDSLTWVLTSDSILTINGKGAMDDYNVLTPWDSYRKAIAMVVLGDSVTSIGNYAFVGCGGVTSLIIPNSVISIGSAAFWICNGLTSLIIPNSVTSIGYSAFSYCNGLTTITIGNSVTSIGEDVFTSCYGLTNIIVDAGNPNYSSVNGILFNKLQDTLLQYPMGKTGSYIIPNTVTSIGYQAFAGCRGLTSITIPNTVTSIGDYAFYYCYYGLTSVAIPNSVTSIGKFAFCGCFGLTSVTIGNSVTTIGDYAFYDCIGLTAMYVKTINPPSVGNNVFYGVSTAILLHVPCGKAFIYKSASTWGAFFNIIADILPNITLQSNDTLMGSVNLMQTYTCTDSTAIIEAIPNPTYHFVQWNDGDTNNPRTISVISDTNFIAEFDTTIIYHITASANNALMGIVNGSGDYMTNTTVTINATANQTYRFVQWNDGDTNNPRTITVISDTTFIAMFVIIEYYVTILSNDSIMGAVIGNGKYAVNTIVAIEATANQGYHFVQWNDGNTDNPRIITVISDTGFTAEFAIKYYHVTLSANDPTMGTIIGEGDYAANTIATIEATSNSGYRFVQWDDGNMDNPRMVTVTSDTAFTVMFDIINAITDIDASSIHIYPNPASTQLYVKLSTQETNDYTIYDITGQIIQQGKLSDEVSIVNIESLANGMYYLRIKGKENAMIKFVKQ
jgi:hypothetical protein